MWGGPLNLCDELPANTFPPASKGILDLLGVPSLKINSFSFQKRRNSRLAPFSQKRMIFE
jgi:hypothetical protein